MFGFQNNASPALVGTDLIYCMKINEDKTQNLLYCNVEVWVTEGGSGEGTGLLDTSKAKLEPAHC